MCGLFGFADTHHRLTQRQVNRLTKALAVASEVRGTDATGIAFNTKNRLTVYKRPLAAHTMRFQVPEGVNTVMGHVRLTTQGSEKKNHNNHPFIGKIRSEHFALAHNGILHNDVELQKTWKLPKTRIQTDSFVAAQMLERIGVLDIQSLAQVAQELEGTFTLALLDEKNSLYFVKGNNPLALWYMEPLGLFLYASTEEILKAAIRATGFLSGISCTKTPLQSGDILKLTHDGKMEKGHFDTTNIETWVYPPYGSGGWGKSRWKRNWFLMDEWSPLDDLLAVASSMGFSADCVLELLNMGLCEEEIEELLYDPQLLEAYLSEAGVQTTVF